MKKTTVLIVEDESIIALDLRNSLRKRGFEVPAIVSSGEDAIRKAAEIEPDVILMDIVLQGAIDGVEAARRIRERLDIPIVYVTAYVDGNIRDRAGVTTPSTFLIKPFDEKELLSAIETAIRSRGTETKPAGQSGT
jgi:CheY-like chemotaxis protein